MTSKLTREQATDSELQMLIDSHEKGTAMFLRVDAYYLIAKELQERRKADSEPVAWMHSNNDIGIPAITVSQKIGHYWMAEFENVQPLYRHAQPAPVVPYVLERLRSIVSDPRALPRRKEWISGQQYSYVLLDNVEAMVDEACRAAMLQAQPDDDGEPTDDERIMAIEGIHNCERCGDEGWVVGEMGITRCSCSQAGNSPVIPDGYVMVPKEPTPEILAVISEAIRAMRGSAATYARVLAAAPQEVKGE